MQTVKTARFFKDLTQVKLSELSGISQSRISLIENFLTVPHDKEKRRISRALGSKPEDIIWTK
jgi:transcriptional regulator with XRE-family HTH domain